MNAATERPTVYVNDRPRPVGGAATLAGLIAELGLAARPGMAVAVNGSVVPRAEWPAHPLAEADRVLIIQATQGG